MDTARAKRYEAAYWATVESEFWDRAVREADLDAALILEGDDK